MALALALVPGLRPVTRFLLGWDVGVGVYLALAAHMMVGSDVHRIRRRAPTQDEGGATILALTVLAALASLAALFAHLGPGSGFDRPLGRLVVAPVAVSTLSSPQAPVKAFSDLRRLHVGRMTWRSARLE